MQNIDLKILIIKTGLRSYEVERAAGFWPGKLSKFIGGALEPTEADKTVCDKYFTRRRAGALG